MERKHRLAEQGKKMLARALHEERQEFGSFFLSRLLGIEVTYAGESCFVTFEALETMSNPQGTLHQRRAQLSFDPSSRSARNPQMLGVQTRWVTRGAHVIMSVRQGPR